MKNQKSKRKNKDVIVEIHNSSSHDGGVALYLPDTDRIIALASERVGKRLKHDADSKIAYEYIRQILTQKGYKFGTPTDRFEAEFRPSQEINHHLAHAASAFYGSGFKKSAVLVMDGYGLSLDGKYNSTSIWIGEGSLIEPIFVNSEEDFPTQSLGYFYSGSTYFLGFGKLESGKTMGLAPYGKISDIYFWLKKYIHSNQDGTYIIDPIFLRALRHLSGGTRLSKIKKMTPDLEKMMANISIVLGEARKKDDEICERDKNFAWAVQKILEEIILGLAKRIKALTKSTNLCLSGGVALNSVANGKLIESKLFSNIFIQPAAGDDGQALGKLLYMLNNKYKINRKYKMEHAYTGPKYTIEETENALKIYKDKIIYRKLKTPDLLKETAAEIASKKVVGWFQGGSEIGPRALGHRSILADPRPSWMRDHINLQVKHREWFRPFAPSVLEEKTNDYFELNCKSPFMLLVGKVKLNKQQIVPSITHVDGTARIQTVSKKLNGKYYDLIKEFERQTGVPLVLNTSFNNAGEPIVETPEDAIKAFLAMNIDTLVLEDFIVNKKEKYDG